MPKHPQSLVALVQAMSKLPGIATLHSVDDMAATGVFGVFFRACDIADLTPIFYWSQVGPLHQKGWKVTGCIAASQQPYFFLEAPKAIPRTSSSPASWLRSWSGQPKPLPMA